MLQLSNCTRISCSRAWKPLKSRVGCGKPSRNLCRCSLTKGDCWSRSLAGEGIVASVGAGGGGEGSGMNRRTAVRAKPLASANTTRFLLRPPPSLRKQLREGRGEEGGEEDEDDDEDEDEE